MRLAGQVLLRVMSGPLLLAISITPLLEEWLRGALGVDGHTQPPFQSAFVVILT